jgi:hypothetical protein
MRANWIKIVFFVLAVLMLGGIAQVLLDPGLGTPDEMRRTEHPSGFSTIPPRGWGASVFYGNESSLRVSPERSTGRQPSYSIVRSPTKGAGAEDAVPYTFQGQPAMLVKKKLKYSWMWRVDFERGGAWYRIALEYPVPTDVEHGPLWPFIESFRVEPVFDLSSATTMPAKTLPATEPASR